MNTAPEFSRSYRLDSLGERPRMVEVEALPEEREALADRFGLLALHLLKGEASLFTTAAGVRARGRIHAIVEQACVATGEPVPATVDEDFDLQFVAATAAMPDDEVELSESELDLVEFDGQAVDLGEALAQTLALALDPFPRSADADAILKKAGVLSEEEASAFGALASLKKKMLDNGS